MNRRGAEDTEKEEREGKNCLTELYCIVINVKWYYVWELAITTTVNLTIYILKNLSL